MDFVLAFTIGGVLGASVYLFLARDLPRMLLGFVLFGLGANLAIFTGGRMGTTVPPLVVEGTDALPADAANPLPQALVLTAIVIGFGLAAFTLALILKGWIRFGTARSEAMQAAEGSEAETENRGEAPPGEERAN